MLAATPFLSAVFSTFRELLCVFHLHELLTSWDLIYFTAALHFDPPVRYVLRDVEHNAAP